MSHNASRDFPSQVIEFTKIFFTLHVIRNRHYIVIYYNYIRFFTATLQVYLPQVQHPGRGLGSLVEAL